MGEPCQWTYTFNGTPNHDYDFDDDDGEREMPLQGGTYELEGKKWRVFRVTTTYGASATEPVLYTVALTDDPNVYIQEHKA
jgi:hypothetical protein